MKSIQIQSYFWCVFCFIWTEKTYCLGTKTLILSKEEIGNITKIVKYLEESDLSIKAASETVENEEKSKMLDSWYVTR